MSSVVQTSTLDAVATITLDRSPVNALEPDHWREVREAIEATNADQDIRVVIIDGGAGRFCAGADIGSLVETSDDPAMMLRLVGEVAQAIRSHRTPVIASIDGPAHGGGLELALACDLRVASTRATFAASGVNMGLVASVRSLVATVGETHARTMLLTGSRVDAATADRWGLVSHFDDDPLRRSTEIGNAIAQKAPLAIEATKRALNAIEVSSVEQHDALMTALFGELARSADHAEAIAAFLDKRPPDFARR